MKPGIKRAVMASAVGVTLALAGCTSTGADAGSGSSSGHGTGTYGYKIAVVTHGVAGDPFWDVVKNGVKQAGKDYGVSVEYLDSNNDPQKQSQLIDAAVNEKVDGLVVSSANPQALAASVKRAEDAGIAVVSMNGGEPQAGVIGHVGQDEKIAGQAAGERLKQAGVTKLLCVIQEAGNITLEDRCDGAQQGFGGPVERLQINNADLAGSQATLKAKLQSDKTIDGVLMLGSGPGAMAAQAVADAGSTAKLATFDLNMDILNQVKSGKILFAVDQQEYLQGYIPVMMITLYKANRATLGGGKAVLTGPAFVTKDNADQLIQQAKAGTR